jgi:hypothetical protein
MSAIISWFAIGGAMMPVILLASLVLYALIAHRAFAPCAAGEGLGLFPALITALPLLGLLGSVGGIMRVFDQAARGVRGSLAAGGVGEALVSTEFGLAAALPALLLHWWLMRRARLTIIARAATP